MHEAFYKSEYMHGLFRFIEENISADFDTELLSSIGYVSRGKLKNDFYSLSGHSVKEYVRKRRLSNALALIKMSDMGLADIAYQCGYSSHQALCRAVRQTLGLTPTAYKNGDTYYFFPPFSGEPLQSVIVSRDSIPHMSRVFFCRPKLKGIENEAITAFLQAFPNYGGRVFGRNGKQKGHKFCYELYLTDPNINFDLLPFYGFEAAGEVLPFNTVFAKTTVKNDEHTINAAWNYLYAVWLQNSMFEYTGEPYYEEYILKKPVGNAHPDGLKPVKLKLYLPVRTRDRETRISLIDNPGLRFVTAKAAGWNAEEIASRTVIEYLLSHCPHVINVSKETYLQKGDHSCVCGVKISPAIQLMDDENVINIFTEQNKYLIFEGSVMGDYERTAALLLALAKDNGMDADQDGIFAVYDARKGFHNLRIKMYLPVKICPK